MQRTEHFLYCLQTWIPLLKFNSCSSGFFFFLLIQAALILLCLADTVFFVFVFYRSEVLWQPCLEQVCWLHFVNVCSLWVSMSHFLTILQTFSSFCLLWRSVMLTLWLFGDHTSHARVRHIIGKWAESANVVCVLTASQTGCSQSLSLSLDSSTSWDTTKLKLSHLITLQWPLSVRVRESMKAVNVTVLF